MQKKDEKAVVEKAVGAKVKRICWFCPRECKTKLGINKKKFYSEFNLMEHLIDDHSDIFEFKFLYRNKDFNVGRKRVHNDFENDGFLEIYSEEVDEDIEDNECVELRSAMNKLNFVNKK
jgi:hypothetical protein